MFRLRSDEAARILEGNEIIEEEEETHFLFGRNDVFSFDEDGSVFSIIEREQETILVHDFRKMGETEREVSEINKNEAAQFLKKTGHNPFMRFDITRYLVERDGDTVVIEKVEQLGFFVNDPDIGSEEVNYGEILKDEMIHDTEKEKKVRRGAEEILHSG